MTISFSPEERRLLPKSHWDMWQALSYGCCKHQDLNMSSSLLHFLRRDTMSWAQDRGGWCLPPHSRVWSHHSILFSRELTICTWCNADWLRHSLNVSWEGEGKGDKSTFSKGTDRTRDAEWLPTQHFYRLLIGPWAGIHPTPSALLKSQTSIASSNFLFFWSLVVKKLQWAWDCISFPYTICHSSQDSISLWLISPSLLCWSLLLSKWESCFNRLKAEEPCVF